MFHEVPKNKILFSNIDFDPSRSIFQKKRLEIFCTGNTLEVLLQNISLLSLNYNSYKIEYIKHNVEKTAHLKQIKSLTKTSFKIQGQIDLKTPEILLGLTEIEGTWYFGLLKNGKDTCEFHINKPHSYSASCSVRTARIMANLAVEHNCSLSVIDPCCGAGTVVLELLSIGVNASANELHPKIAIMARENLKHFGHDVNVKTGDICDIKEHFDVSVLDIPYGIITNADGDTKRKILKESYRIANKLILLTNEDLSSYLTEIGYSIIDKDYIDKGNLRRYIIICEHKKTTET